MKTTNFTAAALICVFCVANAPFFASVGLTQTASNPSDDVSVEDVDNAARSIARYCRILVTRMDGLINEDWATQDLGALASVWDSLNCHQVFGFDPAPQGSVSQGAAGGAGTPRWIVR